MKIRGNTIGIPNPQPDWNQTDSTQADYIKNKPGNYVTISPNPPECSPTLWFKPAEYVYTEEAVKTWGELEERVAALEEGAGTPDVIGHLQQEIDDLKKFHPIAISNVTNNVGTVELGQSIDSVTVTWKLNKSPVSQTVDGEEVDPADRSAVIEGPFTSTKTFAVTATDSEGNTAKGSTSVSFYNGVYYGALAAGVLPAAGDIMGLTRKLQSGRSASIAWTPVSGKRPSYACPTRYGNPKFVISGFEYEWVKLGALDFTNSSGCTEKYDVWQHPQDVTESVTITVS